MFIVPAQSVTKSRVCRMISMIRKNVIMGLVVIAITLIPMVEAQNETDDGYLDPN